MTISYTIHTHYILSTGIEKVKNEDKKGSRKGLERKKNDKNRQK